MQKRETWTLVGWYIALIIGMIGMAFLLGIAFSACGPVPAPHPTPAPVPPIHIATLGLTVDGVAHPAAVSVDVLPDTAPIVHGQVVATAGTTARVQINLPTGTSGGADLMVSAPGYRGYRQRIQVDGCGSTAPLPLDGPHELCGVTLHALLPSPPSREEIMRGQVSMYGNVCTIPELGGRVPWWDGALQALSDPGREEAYACKKARGDTAVIVGTGELDTIVYNEGGNPYQIPQHPYDVAARVTEALEHGFTSIHLFLDGDGGGGAIALANDQFPRVYQKLLHSGPNGEDLNRYVVYLPGWDGIFYVWDDPETIAWAAMARSTCPYCVLGLEVPTGHIPFGEGGADYLPGGRMQDFDYLPIELSVDSVHDNNTYGILERLARPSYVRPADDVPPNDGGDNHPRPWYTAVPNPRGPWGVACFEPPTYRWVRVGVPVPPEAEAAALENRAYLQSVGCPVVD